MGFQNRRAFLVQGIGAIMAGAGLSAGLCSAQSAGVKRKMRLAFYPGSIGIRVGQAEAIELACRFGFEAVEPFTAALKSLSTAELEGLLAGLKQKGLTWATAGLSVDFRGDDSRFQGGLKDFPADAQVLQRAGVSRITTWIMPCHASLTYLQNLRRTATRLREIAGIALDHGLRLGLEYVGTRSLWTRERFPFVHNLPEMRELMAEVGRPNVGMVLDSWHWWQAGDTEADILSLSNREVVGCDLNDAPAGVPKEQQVDSHRELPLATGVIDVGPFLRALNRIDYDGPIRAEPFNAELNQMPREQACEATAHALRKAMALL